MAKRKKTEPQETHQAPLPINLEDLTNQCLLHEVPPSLLTKTALLANTSQKSPLLHLILQTNQLHLVPPNLLTEDLLNKTNEQGISALHLAAATHQLDLIEKSLLLKMLPFKTALSESPLQWAGRFGAGHQIPPECLTENALLQKDSKNRSLLEWLCLTRAFHTIPPKTLSEKAKTLLQTLLDHPPKHTLHPNAQEWLKNTLQKIKTRRVEDTLRNTTHPDL